jgi:hypothetical protein
VTQSTDHELVSLETHGEFYLVQFAHHGQLSEAFWEHKSTRSKFGTEREFMAHLARRSQQLLDEYGDIRQRGPVTRINLEALRA